MRHLFIIPTTSCQASCKYCFTPNTKSLVMNMEVLEKALRLFAIASGGQGALLKNRPLDPQKTSYKKQITFHGGEPLAAGIDFYKKALPIDL